MNIKYTFGIILAVFFGLAFGQSVVAIGQTSFTLATNKISQLAQIEIKNDGEDLGGPSLASDTASNTAPLEDFPSNAPDSTVVGKISEDLSIPNKGKAVVANLESMKLDLYQDGKKRGDFEILSRGKNGTPWETPPGAYEVLYKNENHFSTIGKVWMPFSIQFFGNYFIHGWPYYPDGTPVLEGFSGGCIRLANLDMEKVYKFAGEGTKIIILGTTENTISFGEQGTYTVKNNAKFPKVTAKSYLVADLESGDIINSFGSKVVHPIASLSKMMTALVSLETINQYKTATVSRSAYNTYGGQGSLEAGEKISTADLLYPLLLESSNDAAEVLAEFAGRYTFIKNMNDKAKSVGLIDTKFQDPSGLTQNNVSTAEDLFKLVYYINKYKHYIFDITKLKDYSNGNHTWYSNSKFRNDKNYVGGKNGYTDEAKHTLVVMVELPLGEFKTRKIAIVLLDAVETEKDARSIISYLLNNVYYTD